jgi:starch-binding outer membrane protein, SusD/RagB family
VLLSKTLTIKTLITKNKIMKKVKHIFLLFTIVCLNACNLDVLPDSSVTADSYWKTEDDAKAAVNGLYTRFQGQITNFNWIYWFEARSQNIDQGLTASGINAYTSNDITSNLSDTNWGGLYNIISQANAVIANVDKVKYSNATTRNQLMAEAYFFRAWCYFNLTRLWGDVPIVTNFISTLDDPQLYPERSPKASVYTLMLNDINEAEKLYTSTAIASRNRVSRAAILMLKTDMNLWIYKTEGKNIENLRAAEAAVDQVLALPASVVSLQTRYADVFDKEENNEIIMAIYYAINENFNQYGTLMAQSSTLVPTAVRNNPVLIGNTASHLMQFSNLFYTKYRNRTKGDTRATYISSDTLIRGVNYRWTRKYMGEMNGNQRAYTTDTRLYRMAEAELFKSEILAEKGEFPAAVARLNKVVARAYNTPNKYPSTLIGNNFNETLLDERMIEFAGEAKSWFDLIRFGKVFERVPSLINRQADKQRNILYLPVFNTTIDRNPKITQTPGF